MKLINGDMVIQDLTPKSTNIGGYELKSMNLIYEDGSSTDLKGKFVVGTLN